MQRIIAVDTETLLIGSPDGKGGYHVFPPAMCTSWAERKGEGIESFLVSNGDGSRMREKWEEWLTGDALMVMHNAAYDLHVCVTTWPDLEKLIWDKLERFEIVDTLLREKLLHLSKHGNLEFVRLPDGTGLKLSYGLGDLAKARLGIDMTEFKEGEDSVRLQYELLDGVPSAEYKPEAAHYAKLDAYVTLGVFESQQAERRSETGRASFSTQFFHTATSFALAGATRQGMPLDSERFDALCADVAERLTDDKLRPLIRSGLLRPAQPARPHTRQIGKAVEIIEREGWDVDRTEDGNVDWGTLHADLRVCMEEEGIKFTKPQPSQIDTKALKARVEAVCEATGMERKLTKKGQTCTDSEVIETLWALDEHLPLEPGDEELPDGSEDDEECHPRRMSPLQNYQYRQSIQKIVSTEIPRMMWGEGDEAKVADRIHFNFNVLLATGRTSSFASKKYPSGNGQQIDPRARPCYLPEPGHWILSTDYSAMELCGVAQTTYELFGYSKHRDLINGGYDLHCYLGGSLASKLPSTFEGGDSLDESYALFKALKATDPKFFKHWRKFAKPVGLGYPGGLGAATFITLAKKSYGVDIVKAAAAMNIADLPGYEHSTVRWHAAQVGITEENWTWTPFIRAVALAVLLKDVWLDTYPEMRDYFTWVKAQSDDYNQALDASGEMKPLMHYTTPMGMHRAGATFPAAANGKAMQSPGAEGAKAAFYCLQRECRVGALRGLAVMHDFVHDEFIMSVVADPDRAALAIQIVEDIAISEMQDQMPDVKISVESALSERWLKAAEPVRSRSTMHLLPWQPGVEYEVDEEGMLWCA